MSTVTRIAKTAKQPYGGYLRLSQFTKHEFYDNHHLNPDENVPAFLIGTVIDYLTRFEISKDALDAFIVSYKGANIASRMLKKPNILDKFLENIDEMNTLDTLDDTMIIHACKLAAFDVFYRNPTTILMHNSTQANNPDPDKATIDNIRIMMKRSITWLKSFDVTPQYNFTFEPNGYTITVTAGDGDYLTTDTLWDFKVSKTKPTSKHTLQLAMYWIMGQHSGQKIYKPIRNIGIFNPRLNTTWKLNMDTVPITTIHEIENKVIGY